MSDASRAEEPPPTVLQSIAARTGISPKVLLADSGSEHGGSPLVSPTPVAARRSPRGRGNYQILGEIARGGMGVVLKGHDTDLGRDVAVKVLDAELAKNPAVVQRFLEEAQIGGQLQHPGIVPVYELGLMADDSPYFAMKLVKGRTLAAILSQRKHPSENRVQHLSIFEAVCQTVAYVHSKGVLHRDLKPANILVGAFGEVQVADWGLAKVLRRGGLADERRAEDSLRTVIATVRSGPGSSGTDSLAGSVMGTPSYMAPEQAQGEVEKLDERADVFSLGAILCELLTGQPPYDKDGELPPLEQAARALLDPAKARLETCGADPALVRLCLDCLTPARMARPANGEAVARTLRDYRNSVEERARAAEVEAVEARIKAAEERRARRLTLALAAMVAVAAAAGGGGWWLVRQEREHRLEQTRATVEAAHGESIELAQAGKPAEALAAAQRALALAEAGSADAALLLRSRNFVANAERELATVERERAELARDRALLQRLFDLRIEALGVASTSLADLDAMYGQAFRDYGVDLDAADVVPALERFRQRGLALEVALALDEWGPHRRRHHGPNSAQAENLFNLAMDLDQDPLRQRLRLAIAEGDLATLLELASPECLPHLGPGSIAVLGMAITFGWRTEIAKVSRLLEEALALHPSDYVLQCMGAEIHERFGRADAALVCRMAAWSLQPKDAGAHLEACRTLLGNGRLVDAERAARALSNAHPEHARGWRVLGTSLLALGDLVGARAAIERSLHLEDEAGARTALLIARYLAGDAEVEEVQRAVLVEVDSEKLADLLFALVMHQDPERREPGFALRMLEERPNLASGGAGIEFLEGIVRTRLEDWEGALEIIEGRYRYLSSVAQHAGSLDFIRALLYARLERRAEAREAHALGMVRFQQIVGPDDSPWAASHLVMWRREAEAAMAW